jgi:transposase-like protein
MKIQNMHNEPSQISISRGCSALGISRSGYNKWIRQKQTHYSDPEEMKVKKVILAQRTGKVKQDENSF